MEIRQLPAYPRNTRSAGELLQLSVVCSAAGLLDIGRGSDGQRIN